MTHDPLKTVLCLCGRTASGKSTAARRFEGLGWILIESGKVVADLLKSRPVHELQEDAGSAFRTRAMQLVTGPQPTPLVHELASMLSSQPSPVAIIGVRQVGTIEGLRDLAKRRVRVLYVDTSMSNCATRYAKRDGKTVEAYAAVAGHEVEKDQDRLRALADLVIDNNGPIEELYARADATAQEWSKDS